MALLSGWLAVVLMTCTPSILCSPVQRAEVNWRPWSDVMVAWTSYLAAHMGDEGVHTHLSQNRLDEDRLQPSGGPLHHGEEVGEPLC